MCNWSEAMKEVIFEEAMKEAMKEGMKEGIEKERLNAIGRMLQAGATKEQIISFGYTEKEFVEAERVLCTNVV